MAQVKDNMVMQGVSGKVGKMIVFRQRLGKTIVAKAPQRTAPLTANQVAHTNKFKAAAAYAKTVLADPLQRERYSAEAKRRGVFSTYNMAISDYMNPLSIEAIDLTSYTGEVASELISIEVNDNFKVKELVVSIIAKDDTELESGAALLVGSRWVYTTTMANVAGEGSELIVRVSTYTGESLQMAVEV